MLADIRQSSLDLGDLSVGKCSRCGRVLTDPISIAASLGPICRQHIELVGAMPASSRNSGGNEMLTIAYDSDKPIEERAVSFRRSGDRPGETLVNIPKDYPYDADFYDHSPTGFEWGYGGSGPADFALNILWFFTRDRAFAWAYHQEAKGDFLAGAPEAGADIPETVIRQWIDERRGAPIEGSDVDDYYRVDVHRARQRARAAGDPDWDLYLISEFFGFELPDYRSLKISDSTVAYVSRSQWERELAPRSARFHLRENCERLFRSDEVIDLSIGELSSAGFRLCGKCRAYWETWRIGRPQA